jgi:hypothetical protein
MAPFLMTSGSALCISTIVSGWPRSSRSLATACITGERVQIHQIIMNLGTNAGYAMGASGGTLSVDIDVVTIGDVATAPSADLGAGRMCGSPSATPGQE